MNDLPVRRHSIALLPQSARVILRPFVPASPDRIAAIVGRALALSESDAEAELAVVRTEFGDRHIDLDGILLSHYAKVAPLVSTDQVLSRARLLLIGALFSGEYALESAALFNPSMVPHPDQTGVPEGSLRFLMSLRATGEGHISSIEFRSGTVGADGGIEIKPPSPVLSQPEVVPNPTYHKESFVLKFREMGFENEGAKALMAPLGDTFTRADLERCVLEVRKAELPGQAELEHTLECAQWLADSNYELLFPPGVGVSERVIFPVSANESNGIEDARFVRFEGEDGSSMYCATYTAYNGRAILPQFIETRDFLHFRVTTLNGNAVQNKGMALFPRKIGGDYVMLSRQDDENISIMMSHDLHYWNDPRVLLRPEQAWEAVKIGNCGSPLETEAGWIVITHGVGPLRKYCIGAALLDLEDPTKVLGRLKEPLVSPEASERDGYVPNVVYSCGSLLHRGQLVLPYAMNDKATTFATLSVQDLLKALGA